MSRHIEAGDRLTIDRVENFARIFCFQEVDNVLCSCHCHWAPRDIWNQIKEVDLKRADFLFLIQSKILLHHSCHMLN